MTGCWHPHIRRLIERATDEPQRTTPAAATDKFAVSAKSTHAIHHPASNRTAHRWTDERAPETLSMMVTAGRDRVDGKATYSRAMDVPESAFLTVKDLSVELVSFLIHSKHKSNHTHNHTHSTFNVHRVSWRRGVASLHRYRCCYRLILIDDQRTNT